MSNAYEQVHNFYEQAQQQLPLPQEWIEGFLRHLAWQGREAASLTASWQEVRRLLAYMLFADIPSLEHFRAVQVSLAVEWLAVQEEEFQLKLASVRPFLQALRELADFLEGKHWLAGAVGIREAAQRMTEGGRLHLLELPPVGFAEARGADAVEVVRRNQRRFGEAETAQRVSDLIERVYTRMSGYFQNPIFQEDINRAVFLYGGEALHAAEEGPQRDAFWTSFWDYFLFDYRLLRNDSKPIAHFLEHGNSLLAEEEKALLEDMGRAKFSLFCVQRVCDAEAVECLDLLRGDTFEMPLPGFGLDWKGLLFLGHVRTGASMANYVCHFSAFETGAALRRRIREEVLHMQAWFACQQEDGGMEAFLERHAAAVRQLVLAMVQGERFQVLPELALSAQHEPQDAGAPGEVVDVVREVAPIFGLSHYDVQLMACLWRRFCAAQGCPRYRRKEGWAAALLFTFGLLNDLEHMQANILGDFLDVSPALLKKHHERLMKVMGLQLFDVRYLNEQGLVAVVNGAAWGLVQEER